MANTHSLNERVSVTLDAENENLIFTTVTTDTVWYGGVVVLVHTDYGSWIRVTAYSSLYLPKYSKPWLTPHSTCGASSMPLPGVVGELTFLGIYPLTCDEMRLIITPVASLLNLP